DFGKLQDGLQLGREGQAVSQSNVVQRLDAEAVARKKQTAFSDVPHGEREHASKVVDHRWPLVLVEMDQRLSIALRVEVMAATYQARTQLLVVVDLPVEDDPDRAVFVPNGLMPRREVDDAQPSHSDGGAIVCVHSNVIRSAMDHCVT